MRNINNRSMSAYEDVSGIGIQQDIIGDTMGCKQQYQANGFIQSQFEPVSNKHKPRYFGLFHFQTYTYAGVSGKLGYLRSPLERYESHHVFLERHSPRE